MAKQKKDVSGNQHFEDHAETIRWKSADGKFSTYEDQPGEELDGHITLQDRGEPKKTK